MVVFLSVRNLFNVAMRQTTNEVIGRGSIIRELENKGVDSKLRDSYIYRVHDTLHSCLYIPLWLVRNDAHI